jgi:hypothetical protein
MAASSSRSGESLADLIVPVTRCGVKAIEKEGGTEGTSFVGCWTQALARCG